MTRASELRELGDEELVTRLSEARQELFNLRFQHVTGQLDNYARLGQVRRDVARIETILRASEIAAAEEAEAAAEAEWQATEARRARVAASRQAGADRAAADEGDSDG